MALLQVMLTTYSITASYKKLTTYGITASYKKLTTYGVTASYAYNLQHYRKL